MKLENKILALLAIGPATAGKLSFALEEPRGITTNSGAERISRAILNLKNWGLLEVSGYLAGHEVYKLA